MFRCRACDVYRNELLALRAQLSDTLDLVHILTREASEERQRLLDRLLAVEKPAALRELQRERIARPVESPGRPNLPGVGRVIPRPPAVALNARKVEPE